MTATMTCGERGGGGKMTLTANGEDWEYNNKCCDDNHSCVLLLFVRERDLLSCMS